MSNTKSERNNNESKRIEWYEANETLYWISSKVESAEGQLVVN